MKNKIYISIFLWLSFVVLVVSFFTQNAEKECQALKETQESILRVHKKMYNNKSNSMRLRINIAGNNPRDKIVQDTVEKGEVLLNSMFVKEKIENERVLPFLWKYYYSMEVGREIDGTEKILKKLEEYEGGSEIVKQVNFLNRYQTAFYHLYEHYNKIGEYSRRFTKTRIVNASDTTLGFELGFYDDYFIIPRSKAWWITGSSNKLTGIQTETYIERDTITKMYKVIPSKNGKINPFDYEEVE
ncbi:hypothetical protein V9L05_22215 (plasmid) [Bernardetia sp. Wsw4-3y2]|uniref:hypothetical protein n=1 Tax=Bernardetia sp. Wsw4-3y2 TaxID=3127471 RepID=UPI0030D62637